MKSCPKGWHLPSHKEWQTLVDLAGGKGIAGKKLKAKSGWNEDLDDRGRVMTVATDEYGFSALPGGFRRSDGNFFGAGKVGTWSSSSEYEYDSDHAYSWDMIYFDGITYWYEGIKTALFSVRCVKD